VRKSKNKTSGISFNETNTKDSRLSKHCLKQWDLILAQVKFANNKSTNYIAGKCPFVVYGTHPYSLLDLTPSSNIQPYSAVGKIERKFRNNILGMRLNESNTKDSRHLRNDTWFGYTCITKVFLIRQSLNYLLELMVSSKLCKKNQWQCIQDRTTRTYGVFATFNVAYLSLYLDDKVELDLRTRPFKHRENNISWNKWSNDISPNNDASSSHTFLSYMWDTCLIAWVTHNLVAWSTLWFIAWITLNWLHIFLLTLVFILCISLSFLTPINRTFNVLC